MVGTSEIVRMRDAWEGLIEELLFHKVVQRFSRNISTRELRYLSADPDILARIDAGMTRTSTFSHNNPIAPTDPFPQPDEMEADLKELEEVLPGLRRTMTRSIRGSGYPPSFSLLHIRH